MAMKLKEAVRIAVESMRKEKQLLTFNANLHLVFKSDNPSAVNAAKQKAKLEMAIQVLQSLLFVLFLFLAGCTFSAVPPQTMPAPTAEKREAGQESPAGAIFEPTDDDEPQTYRVIAEHLNVRASPGWNWKVVGWLNNDDIVQVCTIRAGWGYIGSGWVSMQYLKKDE